MVSSNNQDGLCMSITLYIRFSRNYFTAISSGRNFNVKDREGFVINALDNIITASKKYHTGCNIRMRRHRAKNYYLDNLIIKRHVWKHCKSDLDPCMRHPLVLTPFPTPQECYLRKSAAQFHQSMLFT